MSRKTLKNEKQALPKNVPLLLVVSHLALILQQQGLDIEYLDSIRVLAHLQLQHT